jgi:hypothetical protein
MTIELKFQLRQRVKIKELNREGVVNGIMIDDSGICFRVRYFDNGSLQTVWFYDFELEAA